MEYTEMKKINLIVINIIIIIISSIISLYILFDINKAQGYEQLYLLPIVFGLCFTILISKPLITGNSIFIWTFTIFALLRYLALPYYMVKQNFYRGYAYIPPLPSSVQKGIFLMLYEIIISSILIRLLYKRFLLNYESISQKIMIRNKFLIKNKFIYTLFIIITIIILVVNPQIVNGISFLTKFNRVTFNNKSIILSLSIQFVMLAKLFIYFIIVEKLYIKYSKSAKLRYLLFTYLFAILNIGIFIGINRKLILMNAISSLYIINKLYPKHKKMTSVIIFSVGIFIFLQLTIFRLYGSSNLFGNIAGTLQVYLSGPYNMALAIETSELYKNDISLFNIVYDLGRPFYGLGQFFKKFDAYTSTDYFNARLSIGGYPRSDQIMPISGQGLLHFGYPFSPLYLVLSIILGLYTEKKLRGTSSIEKKYILCLICIMFGQAMGVNFVIITNVVTYQGLLFYIIYIVNAKISTRKYSNSNFAIDEKYYIY